MLALSTALATPSAPEDLEDAAMEASATIRAYREAAASGLACGDRTRLAEASVVLALASLVNDGVPAAQASIDAWALDAEVAGTWADLIGRPQGDPSPWVAHATRASVVDPAEEPTRPRVRGQRVPAPVPRRWWSAAVAGSAQAFDTYAIETGSQSVRGEGFVVQDGFTLRVDGEVGRTGLDLSQLVSVQPDSTGPTVLRVSSRYGSIGLSAGYTYAGRVQVVLGPHLGSQGFGSRAMRTLVDDFGLRPDPAPWIAGATLRGRARLERGRIAGMVELASSYEAQIGRRTYWNAFANHAFDAGTIEPQTTHALQNSALVELQVRTVRRLWVSAGLRVQGTTKLGTQGPQLFDTLGLEVGARWR